MGMMTAAAHLSAAVSQHHQVGAGAWAQLSALEQARLDRVPPAAAAPNRFQRDGAVWHITYHGTTIRVPDAKACATSPRSSPGPDRSALPSSPAWSPRPEPTRSSTTGPRAAYKARLAELDQDVDDAAVSNDPERAARAAAERDALISGLTRALGLGGRSRRLGDDTERARKAVTARIGHAINRLQQQHPALAAHLRAAIRTGTTCTYQPAQPTAWNR